MSANKPIIVKKIKKNAEGHHGGSWKVAYADFVTAMMAFFLLMWLLNMTSEEKRVRLSQYFKHFSIYDKSGTSFMEKTSEIFGESGESKQKAFNDRHVLTIENADTTEPVLNSVMVTLEKDIADKLGDTKDQVVIDEIDEGLRIQIIDKEGSLMFERGSTNLTPKGKEVLNVISSDVEELPNKIVIEGHTDSLPYSKKGYSNWELSAERALSARKELETDGIDSSRIAKVTGFADSEPLIKEDPSDPRNRRISLIIQHMKKISIPPAPVNGNKNGLIIDSMDIDKLKSPGSPKKKIIEYTAPGKNEDMNVHTGIVIKPDDIIQNQQNHVIDKEWSPVINNSNGGIKSDNLMPQYTGSPPASYTTDRKSSTESNLIINDELLSIKKKSTNRLKTGNGKSSDNSQTGPSVIKELSSPVISNDWSPVLQK